MMLEKSLNPSGTFAGHRMELRETLALFSDLASLLGLAIALYHLLR